MEQLLRAVSFVFKFGALVFEFHGPNWWGTGQALLTMLDLFHAAKKGLTEAARELLASSADPDVRDASGSVPLHVAAAAGHEEVVRLLLSHGARIDAVTPTDCVLL